MGRVSAANLKPGMILAAGISTFRGQLLLPAGTTLTERHLEKLSTWGISEAEIEGHADPSLAELEASLAAAPDLAEASAALDRRFADVMDEPLMQEILKIAKQQLLARHA
jgi:hypothetical protein